VLFSARLLAPRGIPIFAVNLGDFGFITEVSQDEWAGVFEQYRSGALGISSRIMLHTEVIRSERTVAEHVGLNDSVVSAAGISKVINLAVSLGDTRLGRYRADGVIVATPTGSTAYSAAAGGPILDPEMRALIINPICPFTLSNRPLVLPGTEPVYIHVDEMQRTDIILTIDGQEVVPLRNEDIVCCRVAEQTARIVRSDRRSFFEVLRTKLNWSGGPNA
jgi:NAD+ kinase